MTLSDLSNPNIDIAFTEIRNEDTGKTYGDIRWNAVGLTNGTFTGVSGDNEVRGSFYGPNAEEVGGVFHADRIEGAFGAAR